MTELELYIQLMTVYLYDNFLFLRQILTLMCQITSEGYFSGNFRSPGGSCQLWLAHPCMAKRAGIILDGPIVEKQRFLRMGITEIMT